MYAGATTAYNAVPFDITTDARRGSYSVEVTQARRTSRRGSWQEAAPRLSLNVPFVTGDAASAIEQGDCGGTTSRVTRSRSPRTLGETDGGLHAVLYQDRATRSGPSSARPLATPASGPQDEMPFRPSWNQAKCVNRARTQTATTWGVVRRGPNWSSTATPPVTFDFSSENIVVPADGKVIWTVCTTRPTRAGSAGRLDDLRNRERWRPGLRLRLAQRR
jgi:hypothetical protein